MIFIFLTKDNPKLPPLVAEIGWTHNILVMEKCKDALEREFYIRMTKKFGWSKNVLIHQIENQTYEKTIIEYALQESNKPIGVASYKLVPKLPKNLKKELPSPEQVARLVEIIS